MTSTATTIAVITDTFTQRGVPGAEPAAPHVGAVGRVGITGKVSHVRLLLSRSGGQATVPAVQFTIRYVY